MIKARLRFLFALSLALALTGVVATAARAQTNWEDCTGYFCGYGDCSLQFFWCDGAQCNYTDLGNGRCEIDIDYGSLPPGCTIYGDCTGEVFGSKGLQEYFWEVFRWID